MPPATPSAVFCPWCGSGRPDGPAACPKCGGPSIRSVLNDRAGVDALSFFGEDVATLLLDDKTGAYYVNPDKSRVKWQWLTGQVAGQFPFSLGASNRQKFNVRINPEVGLRGDTEVAGLMLTSSGRCAVQAFVPLLDKNLSNGLVPSNLMFGTSQLQAFLSNTIYALPSFDWTLDIQDLSNSTNIVSPVLFARRFLDSGTDQTEAARRASGMSRFMHPYWLVPTTAVNNTTSASIPIGPGSTVSIPAGQSVTVTYSVPSDASFDCRYILDDSITSVGVNTEINDLLCTNLSESGSRNLIDVPPGAGLSWRSFVASPTVPVTGFPSGGTNTATGGIRAASLPSPGGGFTHLFAPGTDVTVTLVSTDAGTITLMAAFVGLLIYAGEPEQECGQ